MLKGRRSFKSLHYTVIDCPDWFPAAIKLLAPVIYKDSTCAIMSRITWKVGDSEASHELYGVGDC